ncbi:MAG: hypothetical protein ACRED9_10660 [Caulobacteraceae bacterium]
MSIIQFLRIFWARRLVIVIAMASCLAGGVVVGLALPPRWVGTSQVLLDVLKPDPVTNQVLGEEAGLYVATQMALIKDYAVAGRVADQLGWLSDPTLIAQYDKRPKSDTRDFRRWIADRVSKGTTVKPMGNAEDILDIEYTATNPHDAKFVADAIRQAYMDASLDFRRQSAAANADWYAGQEQKAQQALAQATQSVTDYEKANDIVLEPNKLDVETARLQALSGASSVGSAPVMMPQVSAASGELAQVDAQIAEDSRVLGPNHPEILKLRAERAALARQATQERAAAGAAAGATMANIGALNRAVNAAKSKVISQSDKLEHLQQLEQTVEVDSDLLTKTSSRAAEYRLDAGSVDAGVTPLAGAVMPSAPEFPNWPLIIFGAAALGAAIGVMLALLVELFARKVRGIEDLQGGLDVPLLAVIAGPEHSRGARALRAARRRLRLTARRRIAPA